MRRDDHHPFCLWVPDPPGFSSVPSENPESPEVNSVIFDQRFCYIVEYEVDYFPGFHLGYEKLNRHIDS